jgi:hypothetical protein
MSVQYDRTRAKFVVRWREGGKQRVRRFALEPDALAFDAEVNPRGRSAERAANPGGRIAAAEQAANLTSRRTAGQARDGIYAYGTNAGVRWRFVFRQSDGTLSSRRGFTSRTAAADAKRRLLEGIRRGEVRVSRETFETFWHRVLREKRPFMTAGSYEDFATQGRKRLIPFLGDDRLSSIDEARVRDWLGTMVELIDAGEFAPKTVNNARTYLSVVLNEAGPARPPCPEPMRVHPPASRRRGRDRLSPARRDRWLPRRLRGSLQTAGPVPDRIRRARL